MPVMLILLLHLPFPQKADQQKAIIDMIRGGKKAAKRDTRSVDELLRGGNYAIVVTDIQNSTDISTADIPAFKEVQAVHDVIMRQVSRLEHCSSRLLHDGRCSDCMLPCCRCIRRRCLYH